ncbi:protein OSCP1-like isoform X1 [Biomphalaria glabrata]|uniref:Protein OSCP1-like isoform X1 n=1 Tax=Biomphalaria glabrata TaxID=6526 RepID=A0A9U8EGY6_BIOGL|nr:protein OSCP1-like isoform X1 [Biomphalaria glabrata]XP_055889480.1 protein OSCP1-like isoform X1 [Biomphalaria glabrata]XP_055889481.1 protein OSCP1-like isoform X1 [Biomphalaria glabrata]XP_055889482.1 protein OSCP1-like isoform X1 [Biomphalaria glabrata]
MSFKALPLLFMNLGGEMIYILDQRLSAQSIPNEKAKKVLTDIVSTMFNKKFMDEIFKPQNLYSKKAMRTVFDRIAHASIMRLNAASMDKLYDLMTMAVKYQISLALRPKDILLITLNHMDTIRSHVEDSSVKAQVEYAFKIFLETYASLSHGEFQLIRQTLLNFFQDVHTRVSIFLKDKVQNNHGRFVLKPGGVLPYGTDIPNNIKSFDESGKYRNIGFSCVANYTQASKEGSYEMKGDRATKLGTNIYSVSRNVETSGPGASSLMNAGDMDTSHPDPLAKAHLDLLAQLIGARVTKNEFRLNLFKTDQEEEEAATIEPVQAIRSQVVNIDASKKTKSVELTKIFGEMTIDDSKSKHDDNDLLDLMDS